MFPTNTSREHAVQQFATGIIQRLPARPYVRAFDLDPPDEAYQEALQNAISGVLAGLEDAAQADLYARIVSGLEQDVAPIGALVEYEVRATQLWSAL